MNWLWVQVAVLAGMVLVADSEPRRPDHHPRIWLKPTVLSALRAKAGSGDRDWLKLKAEADGFLNRRMPRFTVVAASNSNPVAFTLADPVPWTGSTPMFIAGGTGRWSVVNTAGDRPRAVAATKAGTHTFTVPIDTSALGSFTGQRLALFFSEGPYSGYGYNGSDWQTTLQVLGLAYQVTGEAAYAAKGIELVDYIASLGAAGMLAPAAIDSGFPSRTAIYGLAIGYDWFHDRLTANERSSAVQALNLWFDWFKRSAFEKDGPAYGNYFGGHVMGYGLAGLATQGENRRGPEIVAHIRKLVETNLPAAFGSGGFAGGYPVEGYAYGTNNFQRLLFYLLAVESATGVDVISTSGYPQKIARHLLYSLKPNNWQVSDEGNYAGDYTGVLSPSLPIVLSSLLAGTEEGRWMQFLYQHLAEAPHGGQVDDPFIGFLFYDRARPAADYRLTQPTWFHSRGDDHFYRRSSWRPDAVWMSVAGGSTHWASHQMREAGHIAVQRGNDYLLVNSGQWKGSTGDFGNPQAFDLRSWRGNTLFVDDRGDYMFTGADYLGGQGVWGTSQVLARDGGDDFGYIKTDLTTAYGVGDRKRGINPSVRQFHRSVLSMGTGAVVVFDRARFLKANYVRKIFFHLNRAGGPPVVSGDTTSIRVGRSALFIRTLLPSAPVLAVVPDPVSDTDSRPVTYRLEVSDGVASSTFDALNVLVASASSTTTMPDTIRLQSTDGTMVGAMVKDGGVERIGLFSADGAPQSGVRYTATYPSGVIGVHVLADLLPGAQYLIARDGVRIGDYSASSQGVLTFRSGQGGLFTVRSRVTAEHHRPGHRAGPQG